MPDVHEATGAVEMKPGNLVRRRQERSVIDEVVGYVRIHIEDM